MKFWAVLVISIACTMALVYLLPPSIDFDYMNFGQYGGYSAIPYTVESTITFVMLICLFIIISKIPVISTLFSNIGRHTMGILILHVFIAKLILAPFFTFDDAVCLAADFTGIGRYVLAVASLTISYILCAYGPLILGRITTNFKKESE